MKWKCKAIGNYHCSNTCNCLIYYATCHHSLLLTFCRNKQAWITVISCTYSALSAAYNMPSSSQAHSLDAHFFLPSIKDFAILVRICLHVNVFGYVGTGVFTFHLNPFYSILNSMSNICLIMTPDFTFTNTATEKAYKVNIVSQPQPIFQCCSLFHM